MNENENLVPDEGAENVETHTEDAPEVVDTPPAKTYTEDEVNQLVGKKIARNNAKWEKKLERELATHRELADVLRAGTEKNDVGEITDMFKEHYRERGVDIPEQGKYSSKDIDILARAEADEIIGGEYEDVLEEANRLKAKGEKMSTRERAIYTRLADYLNDTDTERELIKIGVTKEEYTSDDFKNFRKKFTKDIPVTEIYNIYASTKPKKENKIIGSVKNETTHLNSNVKDYYSPEEISRLTEEDLKDPRVWNAVRRAMTGR